MQKRRSNRQNAFLVSMTGLLLAFGCAKDDDGLAPRDDGASGSVSAAAGKAAAVASSGASAGGAGTSDVDPNDGGTSFAGDPESGGSGEAGRPDEGGQSGQAGQPAGGLTGSGGAGGFAGQDDGGGSTAGFAGFATGGVAAAGKGNTGGGGTGGTASIATLPCDVRAVLKARCQTCHGDPPSSLAPMSLLTWSAVSMYADAIQEKLDGDLMPPPGAPDLSSDQQNALLVYVSLGAPPAGNVTCP